uniref:N-acyl-aliphatic-L-amino acid amidohydrolase n=1 Tax=Amphora coffeiformis TaxID=265554 RepID=A0A7S3LG95_9STRA
MSLPAPLTEEENEAALQRFCEFLRFETVSSIAPQTGAYRKCAQWLVHELESLGFLDQVFLLKEAPEDSPVVIAVWKGVDESLPVLLLNSHYDVVPAAAADWTVPAFAGLRRDGKVYGRGTQDMKCVCLQYIEALRHIHVRHPSWQPARSIYLSFVPDEEIGGAGMAAFLESSLYKSLPGIAMALDEGLASTTDTYAVFYGERLPWWVDITATGPTGHGSRFIDNTAVEQLVELANKALAFRQRQRTQLGLTDHENCAHAVARSKQKTLGDVTSLNITTLQAGVQVGNTFAYNCVPPVAKCSLDIRISPHVEPSEIGAMLDTWCRECSKDNINKVEWSFLHGQGNSMQGHATTSTDPEQNPWYATFSGALSDMGLTIDPQVFPAATDSRFLRALGIRALGFSPMKNTEIMLHENDEYIPESEYLQGILVYIGLLQKLASQGKEMEGKVLPTNGGVSSKSQGVFANLGIQDVPGKS